jgi:hypothetical protein
VRINKHGKAQWTGAFAFDAEKLREPLSWRARRLVFANSMSDLFGEGLTNEQIAAVFAVMAASTSTFQLLTKRAGRMLKWFRWFTRESDRSGLTCFGFLASHAHTLGVPAATEPLLRPAYGGETWPLPNVWLGVSCERQQEADERIPLLLKCPALCHCSLRSKRCSQVQTACQFSLTLLQLVRLFHLLQPLDPNTSLS